MLDYLQLPPSSKLSFVYTGDKAVQAFFSIHRMWSLYIIIIITNISFSLFHHIHKYNLYN